MSVAQIKVGGWFWCMGNASGPEVQVDCKGIGGEGLQSFESG